MDCGLVSADWQVQGAVYYSVLMLYTEVAQRLWVFEVQTAYQQKPTSPGHAVQHYHIEMAVSIRGFLSLLHRLCYPRLISSFQHFSAQAKVKLCINTSDLWTSGVHEYSWFQGAAAELQTLLLNHPRKCNLLLGTLIAVILTFRNKTLLVGGSIQQTVHPILPPPDEDVYCLQQGSSCSVKHCYQRQ